MVGLTGADSRPHVYTSAPVGLVHVKHPVDRFVRQTAPDDDDVKDDDDDDDDVVLAAAAAVKRVVETAVVSRGRVSHNSNMVYCNILD